MSMADQFTRAREAALRAAKKNAPHEVALRSANIHDEATGEFGPANAALAAPITVLTSDTELYEAVRRAVLDQHQVFIAMDIEQAAELAALGRCAILITDQALTIEAASLTAERLRKHEPAMVSIAVGNRGQDGVLLGLMTAAAVDRFMLKPITPALARIVIESAGKEHQSRKPRQRHSQRADEVPAFTMRRAAKKPARREDKTSITQPVRVLPSAPEPEERIEEVRVEQVQAVATPQIIPSEPAPDESPQDHTVLVPALSELPAQLQADAEVQYIDIPLTDTPIEATRVEDTRTVIAREHLAIEMPNRLPDTGTSAFQSTGIPRPPWAVLIAAVMVVGALVWWVMSQRLPDIDPRQLITANLAEARVALQEKRYLDPSDRSAFHYFSLVLALDPANAEAKAGIDGIAGHFVGDAQRLIGEGRFAEAVNALQSVRRVRPEHEGIAALETGLREKLTQQYPQVRKPISLESQQEAAVAAAPGPSARDPAPSHSTPASTRVAKVAEPRVATPERSQRAPESQEIPRLDTRVIADAQRAIERKDFDTAHSLINAALEMGVAPEEVVALNHSLTAAEQRAAKMVPPAPVVAAVSESAARTAPVAAVPATPAVATPALPEPRTEPVRVKVVQPRYPNEARMRGIEGWVDLSFVVSATGDVVDPRVEDSSMKHLFARPALAAVRQWKYEPRTVDDPSVRTHARVQFRLTD